MVERHLTQTATRWQTTPDGFGGFSFSPPQQIKCRWEQRSELLPGSTVEVSKAIVYVDRDVYPEDYLILGSSAAANPISLGALKVKEFSKIPDLRNLETVRKCWLI